ncbi:hypothetical protein [Roseovarius indicus]|uniref:hypothetical protein n=1 Tax=Roseovarius indicus TaxID=540747 RepID=UPI004058E379
MTVERLLNPETPPAGHRVQEPKPINSAPRTIAGKKALKQDLGHRNWNQTIHHLFERRNDIRSSIYREVPAGSSIELDPARLGSYTLRLEGGASIALKNPPRVPSGQGSGRTRWWSIRVRAFYASEATIAWPSNVFGARGVALAPGAEGEYSLDEVSALPGQPGVAGTSDVFDLMYDERTGEWFVAWHVRAAETADPSAKNPDAVDPGPAPGEPTPPGSEPGESTDPNNPPDGEYTDPVTGDPIAPEQPVEKAGNLVALHDGAVSFSGDCGQWWQLIGGAPQGAADIATLAGIGTVVRTEAGSAFFSRNLQSWSEIDLRYSQSVDLPVVNGGFERGDLTGWSHTAGTMPLVLDTVQPPQQEGRYYLAGNPEDFNFEVTQGVELPASQFGEIVVRVKVFTEGSASAEVEVRSGWDGQSFNLDSDTQLEPWTDSGTGGKRVSSPVREMRIIGPTQYLGGLTRFNPILYGRWKNGSGTIRETIQIRFDDALGIGSWSGEYEESQAAPASLSAGKSTFAVMTPTAQLKKVVNVVLSNSSRPGDEITIQIPAGWQAPWGYHTEYEYRSKDEWRFDLDAMTGPAGGQDYPYIFGLDPAGDAQTVSIPGTDSWHEVELRAPAGAPSTMAEIILRGADSDVIFDDVRVSVESSGGAAVTAVCRDLANRRQLVATETAILSVSGSNGAKVADAPIAPERIAAHGDRIVLADATGQIALSEDSGISWTTHATSKPVRQLFAHPTACGLFDDGTVVTISSAGVQEYSTHPANSWMTWAARAQRWLLTYPYGSVYSSEDLAAWIDLPDMPVSSQAGFRRFIAADIGRRIGWPEGSRDMFMQDAGQEWALVPRLAAPIIAIEEIK